MGVLGCPGSLPDPFGVLGCPGSPGSLPRVSRIPPDPILVFQINRPLEDGALPSGENINTVKLMV